MIAHSVTVRINGTGRGFNDIADSIIITVGIEMIRRTVTVGIARLQGVVNAVRIEIRAAGEIYIDRIIDTIVVDITVGKNRSYRVFVVVEQPVVVRIGVQMIKDPVAVRVDPCSRAVGFRMIRDAITITVDVLMVRGTIAIAVGRLKRVADAIAIDVSSADHIHIERIINAVAVRIGAKQRRTLGVFDAIVYAIVVRVRI